MKSSNLNLPTWLIQTSSVGPLYIVRDCKIKKVKSYHVSVHVDRCFISANSADPGEKLVYVAFHQGQHCLALCLLTAFFEERGIP